MRQSIITVAVFGIVAAITAPASAATNLVANGSFESGLSGWTTINNALANPIAVIDYGCACAYPTGAYGEAVPVDTSTSASPDAAGAHAAYFVDDFAVDQGLTQLTYLTPGNYEVGFSAYLPLNGFNNPKDATFTGSVLGQTIASFTASAGTAQNWVNYNGVVTVATASNYLTSFVYNSFGSPAKDVVIDRVYAVATTRDATVPEPATWVSLVSGLAAVGVMLRRRRPITVTA